MTAGRMLAAVHHAPCVPAEASIGLGCVQDPETRPIQRRMRSVGSVDPPALGRLFSGSSYLNLDEDGLMPWGGVLAAAMIAGDDLKGDPSERNT